MLNMNEEEIETQVLSEHESAITCMNFNSKNDYLVSGAMDNSVIVWDTISNTAIVKYG